MKVLRTLICILFFAAMALYAKNTISLPEQMKFKAGDDLSWASPNLDDSSWDSIASGKVWEVQGYKDYDGFGWYRFSVTIPEEWKDSEWVEKHGGLILCLGKIDDSDETYLNGSLIGVSGSVPPEYTTAWNSDRIYLLPSEDIRWGQENLIAVRVYDGYLGGGLYKGPYLIRAPEWGDMVFTGFDLGPEQGVFPAGALMSLRFFLTNKAVRDSKVKTVLAVTSDKGKLLKKIKKKVVLPVDEVTDLLFTYDPPQPGFYHISLQVKGESLLKTELYCGYDPEEILPDLTAKDDFHSFWEETKAELGGIDPQFNVIRRPELDNEQKEVWLVEMRSLDNILIRGWYTLPKKLSAPLPAVLRVQGYSTIMGPEMDQEDLAVFSLNIRGHGNSRDEINPGFPGFLIYGAESKETYIYRGAYMDCIRAVDFLMSRPEVDKDRVAVEGQSQGGGLSFAVAALDDRIKACAPDVPFLSNFRDYFEIVQWPGNEMISQVVKKYRLNEVEVMEMLSYFDIMNLAPDIHCPVLMSVGLQDRICPPYINFSAYNHLSGEREYVVYPYSGHEGGGWDHWLLKYDWIREHLNRD